MGCWHGYLSGARCGLAHAQLMPLPLTISCSRKIQICFTFLVPAHPGSPGQRAVKWVCVCVPGPQKHFLGPCRKQAMFKYRDEHPSILEDIFIVVTCCKETAKKLFEHRIEACGHTYFGVCVCSLSRGSAMYSYQSSLSLTDFRTFQDQTHFPRLSRSLLLFQVMEILQTQFQDFPGGAGTL